MKVYVVETIETGERRRVYGKGTRIYVSKAAAIRSNRDSTKHVVEYNLVPSGEIWSKQH
jgi:hypothetical protein